MSVLDDLLTSIGVGGNWALNSFQSPTSGPKPRKWSGTGTLSGGITAEQLRNKRELTGSIGSGLNLGPEPGSIESILAELQRLQDPSRYGADPALLERQAMAQAAAQYDPVIAALRGQMTAAQQRAGRNQGQLESMYGGLSSSLMNEIAPIQQRYADTQTKVADQYKGLEQHIGQIYQESQAEQEEMMKRLNIEAAAPEALEGQQRDSAFLRAQAAAEGQNVASQITQQGGGAVDYTQSGAQMAKTEGTNRVADLMATLEQYLTEASGQIGANEAARAATYQGNLAQLKQSSQESALNMAQRDFENYIKTLGVMRQLQGDQSAGSEPAKSPVDIGSRAMGLGLPPAGAQKVQDAFMSAISDPMVMAAIDPQNGIALSREALANRVVEVGRSMGLSSSELNALHNSALEYFGRR